MLRKVLIWLVILVLVAFGGYTGLKWFKNYQLLPGPYTENWVVFGYSGFGADLQAEYLGSPVPVDLPSMTEVNRYMNDMYPIEQKVIVECRTPASQLTQTMVSMLGKIKCSQGMVVVPKSYLP